MRVVNASGNYAALSKSRVGIFGIRSPCHDKYLALPILRKPKRSGTRRRPRARRLTESEYPTQPRSRPMLMLVKRYGAAALIVASGAAAGLVGV